MNSPRPRKPQVKAETVKGRLALFKAKVAAYNKASLERKRKQKAKRPWSKPSSED